MFDDLNKRLENVSMPNMQYDRAFNYGEYLETIFKKAIMELKQGIVAVEVVDFPASDRLNMGEEKVVDFRKAGYTYMQEKNDVLMVAEKREVYGDMETKIVKD